MPTKNKLNWKEVQRKTLGLYVSPNGKFDYFSALYEVQECRKAEGGAVEWRSRTEQGPPIYLHENSDLYDIFNMTAIGYNRLMQEAKKRDGTNK
jgi:hypothetical protein